MFALSSILRYTGYGGARVPEYPKKDLLDLAVSSMQGVLASVKIPEKWLTEAMNSRLPERFGEVYDHFVPRLYRHVLLRVGDRSAAQDITGETFLRAWEYLLKSADPIQNAKAFLLRIAHNLVTDLYRKRSRQPLALEDISEQRLAKDDEIPAKLDAVARRRAVREALQDLDDEYRDILVWRYIDELSIEEIVVLSGKSANAVYVSVHRALKKLRIVFEQRERET